MMKYEKLLSPLVVREKIIKNRMSSANSLPHFLQGPESFPADGVVTHYVNRAKSGAAIVTCMGVNNYTRGSGMPTEMDVAHFPDFDLYDPPSQNYLIQLTEGIHFYGALACMGFFVGPQSGYPIQREDGSVELVKVENPMGPMPFPGVDMAMAEKEYYIRAKEIISGIDEDLMDKIAESYAQQCRILKWLGFDMASIHMCYRGQIPSKFLSPLTNARTDEYGGSLENRARFPLMILKRIREYAGEDFIVELLLSGEEPEGGYGREDAVAFLKMAEPYVDIVQVRAAEADPNHPTGFNLNETPFLELAEYVKKSGVDVLVASVGGWHYPDTAEKALREEKLDLISMARAWVSNPDYGNLVATDRADDIVPCLRCNKCHGRAHGDVYASICSVNPVIGLEHRLHDMIREPGPKQNVAIIGGGPAGMKAAVDLTDRGHAVTLFEAGSELGGATKHADYVDFKWPLRDYRSYLIRQMEKRGIDVRLAMRATPGMIRAMGFDAVIAAVGAVPTVLGAPGADGSGGVEITFAQEAIADPDSLGGNVCVIGGGEVGMETGMHLARLGREVTVLEMRDELAADTTLIHYRTMFVEAWESIETLHPITNARVTGIRDGRVYYVGADGAERGVAADSVVMAVGMKARRDEALSFYGTAGRFFAIGDCTRPATIHEAVRQAFAAANSL
jgi:2,4-dienoyl-CoA reductase-like NADH-dependent reductase (Old Yellow Enzyme family)/thioredoxin reductase